MPWRPTKLLEWPKDPNTVKANSMIGNLTYSIKDSEILFEITILLPPENATYFLISYIDQYTAAQHVTDKAWSSAVFCLALTQSELAKNKLLNLWDEYDRRLANGQIKVKPEDINKYLSPLHVIGDSLHLYLYDKDVRIWFLRKIDEVKTIPLPQKLDLAKHSRKQSRIQLNTLLYHWDIIESVDMENVITPRKIMFDYIYSNKSVKNINISAEKVLIWARKLPPINAKISEMEWISNRRSGMGPKLDFVCARLGKPLSIALWKQYLSDGGISDSDKLRIWLISLSTYLRYCFHQLKTNDVLIPDKQESQYLQDALKNILKLPEGHIRKLLMSALYSISLYGSETSKNESVINIRKAALEILDESTRQQFITITNNNKKAMKRYRK
jgi:transcription termination factor NusB